MTKHLIRLDQFEKIDRYPRKRVILWRQREKALEGKKILIVDDEPDVLDTLEEMLPMCQVTKATSFEQAREMFETRDFDMAILDIMGVDGYKLLEIANEKKVIRHADSPCAKPRTHD